MEQTVLLAALIGIGLGMLWDRAEPLKPVHNWVIIRLNRLHDWLAVRKLPKYPIWWLKGALSCEPCSSPWLALGAGLVLGLDWYALAAIPVSFAIYHLFLPPKDHRE